MTMDFDLLFPGRFVKAADLKGKDMTLTIEKVVIEELEGDKKETKGIVSFVGAKKNWVLNKTNALCLKAMWGRETDGWIGKRVTLFPTTFDDEPCIRVKGSPDLTEPLVFDLKLPKKKAKKMRLVPTGKATGSNPQPPVPESDEDAPPSDHWDKVDGAQG
jgi:hypothetical protein